MESINAALTLLKSTTHPTDDHKYKTWIGKRGTLGIKAREEKRIRSEITAINDEHRTGY